MMARVGLLLLFLSLASSASAARKVDWQWRKGRGTWFGNGSWPIHIGGCNYGYIWKDEGWDVAALSDASPEYVDSCGECYEVKCEATWTQDLYGEKFDRTQSCRDADSSVVVRIVDTCACTYPANAAGNKRWCCEDVPHFDLSLWAFEKLSELRWGVIPLSWRPVPCDYKPWKPAKPLANPTQGYPPQPPADARRVTRDWPEYRSKRVSTHVVFEDSYENGFYDGSWNTWVQPLRDSSNSGMLGSAAVCAKVSYGGALAFNGWNGVFQDKIALEFWSYVGYTGWEGSNAKIPDVKISISGNKGGCQAVRLMELKPIMFQPKCLPYCNEYWFGWKIYLPIFSGASKDTVINNPDSFGGCGGNSVWDLNKIEFRNDYNYGGDRWLCVDHVQLV